MGSYFSKANYFLFFYFFYFQLISSQTSYTKELAARPTTQEMPLQAANVLFLIDQSNSIWHYDFLRELRFVQETVQRFEIGARYTRVAVATYAENIHVRIRFKDYKNVEDLTKRIGRIKRPHAPCTKLAPGLEGFHLIFHKSNPKKCSWRNYKLRTSEPKSTTFGRKEREFYRSSEDTSRYKRSLIEEKQAPLNVVVVMGDGRYDDEERVKTVIACLRSEKVSVFAVGVGRNLLKNRLDRLATYNPVLYRIDIKHGDPKIYPQDTISDSLPGKIWEFMIKNQAMSEDCLPYRSRIQLNFLFDIMSRNSWRYPILVKIAEDMFIRMIKKYQRVNRKGAFVRMKIYPSSYGSNQTIHPLNYTSWEENDMKRYKDLVVKSLEIKTYKKDFGNGNERGNRYRNESMHRNAWDRLNKVITKITRVTMAEKIPSVQHVIVYVTDRRIEGFGPIDVVKETRMLVNMNKKMASKRRFELFGLALGGFFESSDVEKILRKYQANPHSRMYAFEQLNERYDRIMNNFVDLFCNP